MGVNKIIYDGEILIDLTGCSVTPDMLGEGITAFDAAGEPITGVAACVDSQDIAALAAIVGEV